MKRNRLLFSCISVLLIALIVLASGCSNSAPAGPADSPGKTDQPSSAADANKPVTMTFYASPSGNVIDLKTNWFTQYIEKEYHIKINWLITPSSDREAKQPLLLASGDYPGAFWNGNFSPSDILKYSKQGVIVPMNDLINKYAPNIKKAVDTVPGLKEIMTAPDGKIYGLPTYNWCDHCFWQGKYWINTKLLEKFGLQMPTTTQEFEQVLTVFKSNGIIPLTGATDGWNTDPMIFMMNAFAYNNNSDYFHVEGGKVQFSPAQTGWRKGLEYMHGLYEKGLLDKQALTQKMDVVKRLLAENKIGVIPNGCSCGFIANGSADPNFTSWRTVPPLKGPDGVQYAAFYGNQPTSLSFVMTNKATDAQKAAVMKLLNFIWTAEGTEMLDFGPEGKFWTKPKSGEKDEDGNTAILNTAWNKFYSADSRQNEGWDQMGPMFQSKEWRRGQVAYPISSPDGLASLLRLETEKNYSGKQPKEVFPGAVWISDAESQQYAMYKTNINKYVKQWSAEFIAGTKSIEQNWDAYVKGLDGLGLKQYLDIAQKAMSKPFDTSDFKQTPGVVQYLESLK